MERKIHFGSISVSEEVAEPFSLDYFLLSGEVDEKETYGFGVVKKDMSDNVIEKVQIKDFISVKEKAEGFIKLLIDGIVTPVTVFDVTEDYLGAEYGI